MRLHPLAILAGLTALCFPAAGQQKKPLPKEIQALIRKAEKGDAEAQFNLGRRYSFGRGVAKNIEEGVKWFHKSADQGYKDAQAQLGWMYSKGAGVRMDHEKATLWLSRAAAQGSVLGRIGFGAYRLRQFESGGYKSAFQRLRRSVDQGLAKSQYNLGVTYSDGKGVARNYKTAFEWFTKSAEKGHTEAQHRVGAMYCSGQGASKDAVRGYAWLSIAASKGHLASRKKMLTLTEAMAEDQVKRARVMARELSGKIQKKER